MQIILYGIRMERMVAIGLPVVASFFITLISRFGTSQRGTLDSLAILICNIKLYMTSFVFVMLIPQHLQHFSSTVDYT